MRTLGIILAAGKSSRLYPATIAATKQLLPIYDKPLIYYPLSVLMLAGIKDILIITNPDELYFFQKLLGNAVNELGLDSIEFAVQDSPRGLPDAFRVADETINISRFNRTALILGDNIFYGAGFRGLLNLSYRHSPYVDIYAQKVKDPTRFGVVELDSEGDVVSLEEKPKEPKSNYAVTGLYFFPQNVYEEVWDLRPSARGELEIVDLLKVYMKNNRLTTVKLQRGMTWFDTGTPDSLLEASGYVKSIQEHQNFLVGSPHEIAYKNKWIDTETLLEFANTCSKSAYGQYLLELIK